MMRTLRSRLLLGTAIGTGVVLLISGISLYGLVRNALWSEFDNALAAKLRSFAGLVEQDHDEFDFGFNEAYLPGIEPADHTEYYQIWLSDGRVLARSPALKGGDLDKVTGTPQVPGFKSGTLPDGRAARLAGVTYVPRQEDRRQERDGENLEITLVMARETETVDNALAQLRRYLVVVGLAALIVVAGTLTWSVQRGLRPVERLAAQITNVGESDLGARVDPGDAPSELLPVVDRLNDLLVRLESAFRRERRFTADVAHELRTPLSGVRTMLEVALTQEREPDAYQEVMHECLGVNQQMHEMVENLLSLARADAGQLEVTREKLDLTRLVQECWQSFADQADQRRLRVEWQLQKPCPIESDAAKLRLALHNLLGNAVAYVDEGGHVSIESMSHNGRTELTVGNTGSRVSKADVERVFDRFWRGDASRKGTGQHCGLGLALCKTIVERLGGSIRVSSDTNERFVVRIHLATRDGKE